MTKPDSTLVAVVMDRSGSMSSCRSVTIEGFNEFLRKQKETPGDCVLYYTQFDDQYEIVHKYKAVNDMPYLNEETYVPRGTTALMDAVGKTIVQIGMDLSGKSEDERPSNVIFVIQTDGMENASKEYKAPQIKEMIKEQTDKYNWQFLFLGADLNSMQQATHMGIAVMDSLNYQGGQHTNSAFAAAANNVVRSRVTGQTSGFTQEDKDAYEASKSKV